MHKIVNIYTETYSIMQISHQIATLIKIIYLAKIQKVTKLPKKFQTYQYLLASVEILNRCQK